MGRAARNYGGTRGHGYFPLPGERPNINRHVMNDSVLFRFVKNSERKIQKSEGLKVVPQPQSYKVKKSVSEIKVPQKCKQVSAPEVSETKRSKVPYQEKEMQRDFPPMTNTAAPKTKKKRDFCNKKNGEASSRKKKTSQIDQNRQPEIKQGTLIESDNLQAWFKKEKEVPVSKHDKKMNFTTIHLLTKVTSKHFNL